MDIENSPLTGEQLARAEALHIARRTVVKSGFGGAQVEVDVAELVDLAQFILDGRHPLADYIEQDDTGATQMSENPETAERESWVSDS